MKRHLSWRAALLLMVMVPASAAAAADEGVFSPGPEVGERIPEFRLSDQHGKAHAFADLTGPDGLLLLFYRTADW